jgi:hypothetical protein
MSDKPNDDPRKSAERVVEHNEKFNVPVQTEKEEAQVFENASSEDIANEQEIRRKKEGLDYLSIRSSFWSVYILSIMCY